MSLKRVEDKLLKIGVQLFVFLIPTQLSLHFWPTWSHVFGIRVDYFSPAIHLTDIVFVFLLLYWFSRGGYKKLLKRKYFIVFTATLIFAAINTVFSSVSQIAVLGWIKVFEILLLTAMFKEIEVLSFKKWFIKTFLWGAFLVSVLALLQFIFQKSLGGPLYFLGERSFTKLTPGISTVHFKGREFLRAYSTFSHPNSLAGYLGVSLVLTPLFKRRAYLFFPLLFFAFLITFSANATLALLMSVFILLLFKKVSYKKITYGAGIFVLAASLLMPIYSNYFSSNSFPKEIVQRSELSQKAALLASQNVFAGTGMKHSILPIEKMGFQSGWILQPTHNMALLAFAETGMVGLLFIVFLFIKTFKSLENKNEKVRNIFATVLIFVLLTGLFDHYWFTLQQNQLLLGVILGLSLRRKL